MLDWAPADRFRCRRYLPDTTREANQIMAEPNYDADLARIMQIPPYMGDDAFTAFLKKHDCPGGAAGNPHVVPGRDYQSRAGG